MLIFIVAGIFLVIAGVRNIIKHFIKQRIPYEMVYGKVVKFNETKSSSIGKTRIDTSTYFTPVFEYRYDGQVYKSEHNVRISNRGKPSAHFEIGKEVELRVYEGLPHQANLNSPFGVNALLYTGVVAIILGGTFVLFGIISN